MIQLTDKLFALSIPEKAKDFTVSRHYGCFIYCTDEIEVYTPFPDLRNNYTILGTCSKDTIDFDVETVMNEFKLDFGVPHSDMYQYIKEGFIAHTYNAEVYFRSLLTSKGCNPDEKHLIIEKI